MGRDEFVIHLRSGGSFGKLSRALRVVETDTRNLPDGQIVMRWHVGDHRRHRHRRRDTTR